jgi:ribonuclease G
MSIDIIINATAREMRIAVLEEEGKLAEFWVERPQETLSVGDIYKGVVEKVLPGLNAAFVNIGTFKSGFLSLDDAIFDLSDLVDEETGTRPAFKPQKAALKAGQQIMVQISKEPIGTKGPRLTSYVSFPGRFCVLIPNQGGIGISRKIENREERSRLRKALQGALPKGSGLIVRTAAAGEDQKTLERDVKELVKDWQQVQKQYLKAKAPFRVHAQPPFIINLLNDLASYDIQGIVTDDKRTYDQLSGYFKTADAGLKRKVLWYREEIPLFEAYQVESQVEKALNRRIWLKSGGYIAIDQTEALTAVDVNSGKFTGKKDAEAMVLKVNLEAAQEIARQIRLRDIGGIIVVDFIDMKYSQHRNRVLQEFTLAVKSDRSKPNVYAISPLGLVEMSRKRIKPSLWQSLTESCPTCQGAGRIFTAYTSAQMLERKMLSKKNELKRRRLSIKAGNLLFDYLSGPGQAILKGLNQELKTELRLSSDRKMPVNSFKIVNLENEQEIA